MYIIWCVWYIMFNVMIYNVYDIIIPISSPHLGQSFNITKWLNFCPKSAEYWHVVILSQKFLLNIFKYGQGVSKQNLITNINVHSITIINYLWSLKQKCIPDMKVGCHRKGVHKQTKKPIEREKSRINTMIF